MGVAVRGAAVGFRQYATSTMTFVLEKNGSFCLRHIREKGWMNVDKRAATKRICVNCERQVSSVS
jgi:hypothetical protein